MSASRAILLGLFLVSVGAHQNIRRPGTPTGTGELRPHGIEGIHHHHEDLEPLAFKETSFIEDEDETQEQLIADMKPKSDRIPAAAYVPKDEQLQRLDNVLTGVQKVTGLDLTGVPMLIEKVVHPAMDAGRNGMKGVYGFVNEPKK